MSGISHEMGSSSKALYYLIEKLITLGLLAFFISRVISSVRRFEEKEVGTAFTKVVSNTVNYPSMTVCTVPNVPDLKPGDVKVLPTKPSIERIQSLSIVYVVENGSQEVDVLKELDQSTNTLVPHNALYPKMPENILRIQECFTFNPSMDGPAGFSGRIKLYLAVGRLNGVIVYVHNKEEIFVPNHNHGFGSSHVEFDSFKSSINYKRLIVHRTHELALDKPSARCVDPSEAAQHPSLTRCLTDLMEAEVKCRTNIYGTNHWYPICNETKQLEYVFNMTESLRNMNDHSVLEETGCMASCHKDEYSITVENSEELPLTGGFSPYTLCVRLWFPSGRHMIRKEYMIYGFDSLIADVGGYLGLLLGHSLLSLFNGAWQWYFRQIGE